MKTVVQKKYIWFGPFIATVMTGCFQGFGERLLLQFICNLRICYW